MSAVVLPRLYAIVDVEQCGRRQRSPLDVTNAFLSAGISCLQLRAKSWGSGAVLELAQAMTASARESGALVIVNDRVDVAAIANASGAHVGQEDLPPADARRLLGPRAVVGVSTHTDAQLDDALVAPSSYVAIGPVYATHTKDTGYDAVGLSMIERAAAIAHRAGRPLVAIGGITLERAADVIAHGADSVAVISDLLEGDPEARARAFLARLR